MASEFVSGRGLQTSNAPPARGPEILSSPTPSSAFASSPSAFTALTANPAAAAIVNIANHAHSSAAELAKRASVSDLGGVAKAKANVNTRPPAPSVVNDAMSTPHLFSAPVANVNAAIPPSMVQPTFNAPATAQPSWASPDTSQRSQSSQSQHTAQCTPSPASARMHARRGSTASLNLATSASGSPSPTAYHGGISKRASVASLRGQPAVPSPLSRTSPLIGQMTRTPEVKATPVTPQPKIHAPTPVFGSMSKRPSVADLTAAAAAPAFAPGQLSAARAPAASPVTESSTASNVLPSGGMPSGVASETPLRAPAANKAVLYETPLRHMPGPRTSSPAVAWTPATRPKATEEQAGPGVIGEARHHSAGGALAGYDAPPASPVVGVAEWKHATVDISSLAESMADQFLEDECERRQRTFTNAPSPVASLRASVSAAKQACDSPVSQSVQDAPAVPVTSTPIQLATIPTDLGPHLAALKEHGPEILFRLSAETEGSLQPVQADDVEGHLAAIEVTVHNAEDKPVRPPTPSGQVSLTNLVAQLQVGGNDAPDRPTSVVPNIHAGTPDRPAHWTIDDQGKLRAKRTGNDPEPVPDMATQPAQEQPQPQTQRTAGPPPRRRERAGEQPEAYKPYPQNAGPAQPTDRFSALRRRSMYFAREEGGIRGESPDKDGSPGGGAGLWRRGSANWRKREDEE